VGTTGHKAVAPLCPGPGRRPGRATAALRRDRRPESLAVHRRHSSHSDADIYSYADADGDRHRAANGYSHSDADSFSHSYANGDSHSNGRVRLHDLPSHHLQGVGRAEELVLDRLRTEWLLLTHVGERSGRLLVSRLRASRRRSMSAHDRSCSWTGYGVVMGSDRHR
jgi:hypothetical protein